MGLIFPDPVLDAASTQETERNEALTGVICSHCHKEIRGKVHRSNNHSYDTYCWNLRFILRMGDEEEQRREDLRRTLSKNVSNERQA
ncbi:MAG: hypothetical protein JXA22_05940 [Candidatus Thermoplasmatota archaeon]|nr:hypothetical protein [Candidatus Thermoplasmatota archaeon]